MWQWSYSKIAFAVSFFTSLTINRRMFSGTQHHQCRVLEHKYVVAGIWIIQPSKIQISEVCPEGMLKLDWPVHKVDLEISKSSNFTSHHISTLTNLWTSDDRVTRCYMSLRKQNNWKLRLEEFISITILYKFGKRLLMLRWIYNALHGSLLRKQ